MKQSRHSQAVAGVALDRVTAADRPHFARNPEDRWYFRPADPCEWPADGRMALFSESGEECRTPHILVLASPSRLLRVRYLVGHPSSSALERSHVAEALRAADDLGFSRALASTLPRINGKVS